MTYRLSPAQWKLLQAVASVGEDGYELANPRGRTARALRDDHQFIERLTRFTHLMVLTDKGRAAMLCPFCKRPTLRLMIHHLVPKAFGGTKTIDTCRDCHKAIHTLLTNRSLKGYYYTVERLVSYEPFAKMVAHIAKQDPGGKVRMKRAKKRR